MAMLNDLAQGGITGDIHGFPSNMQPPPHGPIGVEGQLSTKIDLTIFFEILFFLVGFMFVDNDQFMGGLPPGYPPRAGPRF